MIQQQTSLPDMTEGGFKGSSGSHIEGCLVPVVLSISRKTKDPLFSAYTGLNLMGFISRVKTNMKGDLGPSFLRKIMMKNSLVEKVPN